MGPALASTPIHGAAARENAADGADTGSRLPACGERGVDGTGAVLPQEALGPQLPTQRENAVLECRWRAMRRRMAAQAVIAPVHPIETARTSPVEPVLHEGRADTEVPSDGALTPPATNGLDQSSTLRFTGDFLLIAPFGTEVFSPR